MQPVAGYRSGGPYPDPYPDDKPLFTISAANVEQYRKQLSAGQIALLQKHPTWRMNVYPTRRSAAFPQPVYAETAANAGAAKLAPGGNGVTGTKGGIPFPAPKDGLEAIWNTMLRYRGDTYATRWRQAAVTRGGAYTLVDFDYEFDFNYGNLGKPARDRDDNRLAYVLQTITGPARLAGRMLLVDEPVDHAAQMRSAWTYDPGAAARPARAERRATTIRAPPRTACAPATTSRCTTARPIATSGSSWAGRSSTFPTTRTGFPAASRRPRTCCGRAMSIPTTHATNCTASGSWRRR